ncbi:helix-turn-helix domain-containing protein [Mucilaginibacter sp. CAU 1740]|uniref:helix-turn-helix domain-containing protein n=1 Tax=Mucilaginibacter sp. CAU 1740 TaxID=3140365 RepID=UPI00325B2CF4
MIYLTSAIANMRINGVEHQIKAGEVLLVPTGQVFSFDTLDINTGFLCSFNDEFLHHSPITSNDAYPLRHLDISGKNRFTPTDQQSACIHLNLSRMLQLYTASGLGAHQLIRVYLLSVIFELLVSETKDVGRASSQLELATRFKLLLLQHFRTQHKAGYYADLLCVTPNHLNKILRKETGRSTKQWIAEALLLEVKIYLNSTNSTISEVAVETGFADVTYFSRFFKKYTGITPLDYRKRIDY